LIDLAWAFYEFLAIYGILLWLHTKNQKFLIVAGIMMGFALGSKYLAIYGLVVIFGWIIWSIRRYPIRSIALTLLMFAIPSILIASPWYLKNLYWTGNPVFPFFFGGIGWDATRLSYLTSYMNSFGMKDNLWDYLLLPINLFLHHDRFGTLSIGGLNPLLLLILFIPIIKKDRIIAIIGLLTILRFVLWATGSQQIRFLLPIFPLLSILFAYALYQTVLLIPRPVFQRAIFAIAIGGSLIVTMVLNLLLIVEYEYGQFIIGKSSKHSFLSRMDSHYLSSMYILEHVPDGERVLMLWDGRSYYCTEKCLPDAEQSLWTQMVLSSQGDLQKVLAMLREKKVTHFSWIYSDATYFTKHHDPLGVHNIASDYLKNIFLDQCGDLVHQQGIVQVYKIPCLTE
jgi:hypothetical protein